MTPSPDSELPPAIADLSRDRPLLVVFLRHLGCTFCREACADLASQRRRIEGSGAAIAIVHPTTEEHARPFLARYGLEDLPRFADPERRLYRAFGLRRGGVRQLFGPRLWWRGFEAGVLHGHWVGRLRGDGFQMPGVFLVRDGVVVRAFRHADASDRPDYAGLACPVEASCDAAPSRPGGT